MWRWERCLKNRGQLILVEVGGSLQFAKGQVFRPTRMPSMVNIIKSGARQKETFRISEANGIADLLETVHP